MPQGNQGAVIDLLDSDDEKPKPQIVKPVVPTTPSKVTPVKPSIPAPPLNTEIPKVTGADPYALSAAQINQPGSLAMDQPYQHNINCFCSNHNSPHIPNTNQ